MSNRIILKTALAAMLTLAAGSAYASERHGSIDRDTEARIRATLTEQGYDVRKIKSEDGLYEAYAVKDGVRMEVYLDRDMKIVRTQTDD